MSQLEPFNHGDSTSHTKIWESSNFVRLFIIAIAAGGAGELLRIALPLIAYEIGGSSVDLGAIRSSAFLPHLLLAAFIGVLVDQIRKANALRMFLVCQLPCLGAIGVLASPEFYSLPALLACVFVLMGFQYAFTNAFVATIKIAISRRDLPKANSILGGVQSGMTIVGPALIGVVLVLTNLRMVLMICTLAIAFSLFASLTLHLAEKQPLTQSIKPAIAEGVAALVSNRPLLLMAFAVAVTNGTEGIYSAMLIFLIKDGLAASDLSLGLVLSVKGIGMVLGAMVLPAVRRRIGAGKVFCLPILFTGIAYSAVIFASNIYILGVISFFEGMIAMFFVVGIYTFRQETTSAEVIGRVAGLTGAIFKIGMPPMILLGGFVADVWSVTTTFAIAGLINVSLFSVVWRSSLWRVGNGSDSEIHRHSEI